MGNFGYPWRMPFPAGISCDIFLLRFVILVAAHHDSRFFAEYPGIGKPAECTFGSLEIAGQLLRGEVSAMGCICDGSIAMSGMVNMIDNVNRILDRVSIYLA